MSVKRNGRRSRALSHKFVSCTHAVAGRQTALQAEVETFGGRFRRGQKTHAEQEHARACNTASWMPAFAGMTLLFSLHLRGGLLSCYYGRVLIFFFLSLLVFPASCFAQYPSSYLNVTLSELQAGLSKVSGPVTFTPRPGNSQGTQEVRLPESAGTVQAAGSPGNLSVVVLWLPVAASGKFASAKSRPYLVAFVGVFTGESDPVARWIEQVLERALVEKATTPHLESQLFDERQLKVTYVPTLSPPMLSITVEGSGQGGPQ